MQITINDDFDLEKIVNSGQCFRPREVSPGKYLFITGEHYLYISETNTGSDGSKVFEISCDLTAWENVWIPYFDLNKNYSKIRSQIPKDDSFMQGAMALGQGIRILRQEPFETLISFIISQRKSIPAIRKSIDKICEIYGKELDTPEGKIRLFPTPEDFLSVGLEGLSLCSLGYRLSYIEDAIRDTASGSLDLSGAFNLSDDELLSFLMEIKGVGIKVASCVALFAYGRCKIAPVDVWINRVIEEHYNGVSPFPGYGENSGIYQQYAFFLASQKPQGK